MLIAIVGVNGAFGAFGNNLWLGVIDIGPGQLPSAGVAVCGVWFMEEVAGQ